MAILPSCPCAHAVIRRDEVLADEHSIIAIGYATDQLSVHLGPAVSALMVCTQWV